MSLILLYFKSNFKEESDESLDNPLPNSSMFAISFLLKFNVNDESELNFDSPIPINYFNYLIYNIFIDAIKLFIILFT